jgi:hypothetical protein
MRLRRNRALLLAVLVPLAADGEETASFVGEAVGGIPDAAGADGVRITNPGFYLPGDGPKIPLEGDDDNVMNIPSTWSIDNAVNENKPRSCDAADELACEQDYMRCLLYEGPANDRVAACYCAGQFYGKCLRAAGCAAKQYQNCWKEHQMQDCDDMTVCGSNCVGDGNGLDLSDTRILPINNFARNFLRFSVCDLGVDEDVLERFEVVRMKRCADPGPGVLDQDAFTICPYWIPPSTFTALAIPKTSTYIRLEYANFVDSTRIQPDIGNGTMYYVANVLSNPKPIEVSWRPGLFCCSLTHSLTHSLTNSLPTALRWLLTHYRFVTVLRHRE